MCRRTECVRAGKGKIPPHNILGSKQDHLQANEGGTSRLHEPWSPSRPFLKARLEEESETKSPTCRAAAFLAASDAP